MKHTSLFVCLLAAVCVVSGLPGQGEASIVISEFLADPPTGIAGDANMDGTTSSSEDEFVELLNTGQSAVNLAGWSLSDEDSIRHIFADATVLGAQGLLVVFGGGSPAIAGDWQAASTGRLRLNNAGDVISLLDSQGHLQDVVIYGSEGGDNQSLVRWPEDEGDEFIAHSLAAGDPDFIYSPGQRLTSAPVVGATAVPEPSTLSLMLLGSVGMLAWRKF